MVCPGKGGWEIWEIWKDLVNIPNTWNLESRGGLLLYSFSFCSFFLISIWLTFWFCSYQNL